MQKFLTLIILCFFVCGCIQTDKPIKNYIIDGGYYFDYLNDNGILIKREIFSSQNQPIVHIIYKDGKFYKSKVFHNNRIVGVYKANKNGFASAEFKTGNIKIYGTGRIDSLSRERGWWTFYNVDKKIISKRYSIAVGNEQIITQKYLYKDGKIDTLNSVFADLSIKNEEGNSKTFKLIYNRVINKDSYVSLLISTEVKDDFSNIGLVKFDTISFRDKHNLEFTVIFETKKKRILRGYIVEQYSEEKYSVNEEVDLLERRTYFEKELDID